ncbi:glycosyltransferase family 2 protein [Anaeromyxobacter terrae]|uniref:glycosyltransferase family 2 protein n=1 Tax=Anaeromyxobacter terrae TaxID=2925406 RepID=UPI001F5A5230|nr:glycosyltransferase family 2 protein [Anaeromyxobacter sp. SG22]
MRLGGYVIHGDNADTLGRCLESIAAVADELVAVDSCSTDGSAALARARGFRSVVHPWAGYGAARAAAARELHSCDYIFFLDSDEWLLPDAVEALRAWKSSAPAEPYCALVRRDWAELPTGRFLFRTENHVRLVRADHARWDAAMIVHEALPSARKVYLPIALEHRFATDAASLRAKADRYALLWALRFHAEGRRPKRPAVQKLVHLAREAVLKGAVFRGGLEGLRLAEAVAHHQSRKYALLAELRGGAYPEFVRALREGRLEDLYRMLPV